MRIREITIKVFNNLSKKIEKFDSIESKKISMYVCGPTVYDDIHLGNARSIIFFDIVHRFFIEEGYDVNFLHNITDIDDKIINKSLTLKIGEKELSKKYCGEYLDILKKMNIKSPTKIIRVTEVIDDIKNFIQILLDKHFAYISKFGIFFDTSKIQNYTCLISNQNISEMKTSIKNNTEGKKNDLDFAIWKFTSEGLNWEFPKGHFGRPGWHTECVVLINKYFNMDLIDIHGGGIDLIFPHHENEIAQQIAYKNTKIANYWIHNGHLYIDENKMSKSLGNIIKVKDFLSNNSSNVLRYLFCLTNYRSIFNLRDDVIEQSKQDIKKIENTFNRILSSEIILNDSIIDSILFNEFLQEMNNNFNLANVLTIIQKLIKTINKAISNNDNNNANKYFQTLKKILNILGFKI